MLRRAGIVLLLALAALAPGGLPARAHPPQEGLERIEAEIRQKQKLIDAAERREAGLLDEITASDERRDAITGDIAGLSARLAEAWGRLALARADLLAARGELGRRARVLDGTEARLEEQRADLGERAATAYRLGPAGYLEVVLGAADLRSLADRVEFARAVLLVDSVALDGLRATRDLVAGEHARIGELERRTAVRARQVRREVERIARLKAEQERLRARVDLEISYRQDLLGDIQQSKAEYEAAVRELEEESARIRSLILAGGSSGSGVSAGQLAWPTAGPIVSGYGWRTHPIFGTKRFHAGVDIDGACGQPISAAEAGQVISAGWAGGYGQATVVDHGDGLSTLYAHQSAVGVGAGQAVSRGAQIGAVGSTGWSTGCHLHFEVRVNGEPVDPVPYLT